MYKYRLILSEEIEAETDEESYKKAKYLLSCVLSLMRPDEVSKLKLSLVRDGDRSGLNLLLPRVEGRFGNHYQGRKATVKEVFATDEQDHMQVPDPWGPTKKGE